ncbi:uncharacterized protein LOC124927725 [Impatiens glandulifera]|uniref:uncharacterized protein LOC124927725 n=1 Tax=Impatiens glandulifera TaxID=253017 RepID=UPI001FB1662D|nr:uncharacterized protein LOC124927725 [Impatiens glandulifera]
MAPLQKASSHGRTLSSSSDNDQTIITIQHFTHSKHPLQRVYIQAEYNCDGCSTLGGAGFRYRCSAGCDFDLHEQCATSPFTLSSNLHPNHQLILVNQPGNGHFCNCCRQSVNGLFYTCRPCNVDIHPICTHTQTQGQVLRPTGAPALATRPKVNWAASQQPNNNNISVNSSRFVNQGFQQQQPYNNNNGFVTAPAANPTVNWAASQQPNGVNSPTFVNQGFQQQQQQQQTYNNNNGFVTAPAANPTVINWGASQLPNGVNSTRFVNQGFQQQQQQQPYNNNNNNGFVAAPAAGAATGSNRQTNNNTQLIGKLVRKAVTASIFGVPL